MDAARKGAYRYLLYWAMLDIRPIEGITAHPWRLLNPLELRRSLKRASRAGGVADWLHNLAMYAAADFEGFDEEAFWNTYDWFARRHGESGDHYRDVFQRRLDDLRDARASS